MRLLLMLASWVLLQSCMLQPTRQSSLFERIGGLPMLTTLASETLDVVTHDPRTQTPFKDINQTTLKANLRDFLCIKTGGNCHYEGETMKNAHSQANISTAQFELLVQALRDRMDANHVPTREKNELLQLLAPMKRDIVTQPKQE